MALVAVIPRNLMLDKRINNMARLLYGYYSMMLRSHQEEEFLINHVVRFIPLGLKQIDQYSRDLATRRYITYSINDTHITIGIPEEIHSRIDTSVDNSSQARKIKISKDAIYVSDQIVSIFGNELSKQLGKDYKPKVTKAIQEKVQARLKTFSSKEILDACENRMNHLANDPWWNKPENVKFKKNIFNLINTDDKLDKWLNIESTVSGGDKLKGITFD